MADAWCDLPDWLQREDTVLAPYAQRTRQSRGRRHPEEDHPYRTLYQRDRDRIVHSTAFRRLMGKTQVMLAQTDDHHRTRLTHTLEVAMISRTIARRLGLNEDLVEAIALSHDLGHPPFGHAGERALDECLRQHGGFEHNRHGLRLVTVLEYRYAEFAGLNLSLEVLEAMASHSKRPEAPEVLDFLQPGRPFLEAQVVDAADSLAYTTHDIDDALALNLITFRDLEGVELWQHARERAVRKHRLLPPEQLRPAVIRAIMDWQVTDLLEHSMARLREGRFRSVQEVRDAPRLLIGAGPELTRLRHQLENFLHAHVYRHYRVQRMAHKGQRIVNDLFAEFARATHLLPPRYCRRAETGEPHLAIGDYLAGMTDRFAQEEYLRLFQPFAGE